MQVLQKRIFLNLIFIFLPGLVILSLTWSEHAVSMNLVQASRENLQEQIEEAREEAKSTFDLVSKVSKATVVSIIKTSILQEIHNALQSLTVTIQELDTAATVAYSEARQAKAGIDELDRTATTVQEAKKALSEIQARSQTISPTYIHSAVRPPFVTVNKTLEEAKKSVQDIIQKIATRKLEIQDTMQKKLKIEQPALPGATAKIAPAIQEQLSPKTSNDVSPEGTTQKTLDLDQSLSSGVLIEGMRPGCHKPHKADMHGRTNDSPYHAEEVKDKDVAVQKKRQQKDARSEYQAVSNNADRVIMECTRPQKPSTTQAKKVRAEAIRRETKEAIAQLKKLEEEFSPFLTTDEIQSVKTKIIRIQTIRKLLSST